MNAECADADFKNRLITIGVHLRSSAAYQLPASSAGCQWCGEGRLR
jgi:hypothetical protein